MRSPRWYSSRIVRLAGLAGIVNVMTFVGGCATGRIATVSERQAMRTSLAQYATLSRLSGAVHLDKVVRVKDDTANVGYSLYNPRVQMSPLKMHAKMVRTETGWRVESNTPDATWYDLSVWPMVTEPGN